MAEITEIKFKDIKIQLPESREAVAQARKLLELFEETLDSEKPKHKPQNSKEEESTVIAPLDNTDKYNFQECEKFDHSNLPAHKAGKSTYWLSDDAKRVCIEREGYAPGLYVRAAIDDLKYLQVHPDQTTCALKNFIKHKKYHVTGFLKDVDISTLYGEGAGVEIKEMPEQHNDNDPKEYDDERDDSNPPKTAFFYEDTGFDYMAVQPKWVGRTQIYTNLNNGKLVIKLNHAILLTTKDTIEKLLQYNDKDLNYCIRGINPQKQNILRVYLGELKKRREVQA